MKMKLLVFLSPVFYWAPPTMQVEARDVVNYAYYRTVPFQATAELPVLLTV